MKPRLTPIHSLTPSGQASENKHSNTYNTKISHSHNVTELKRKSSENLTPITSRTLKSRIKQMLQGNAKVGSPQSNKLQRLQKESIEEAIAQAQKDRLGGTEYDIGPFYGLPSKVEELFTKHRKIKSLYEWQKECLSLPAIQQRQNLIYSLPTSGGKTLVAEILILRELLCRKKDTMLILPFVSIVQEKVRGLAPFAVDLDFLVEEYAGHKGHMPPKMRQKSNSLYICTMEKANGLVNCLIEMGKLDNIGLVVVDELHMLGEGGSRGAVLEMTLTKLMHASTDCQIIGMSATLNNTSDLTKFLQAELYSNNFRPVELTEYVKLEDNIFTVNADTIIPDEKLRHDRIVSYPYTSKMVKQDPDHLCGLVSEVIPDKSCLVFCSTKKNCENVAVLLCEMMPRHLKGKNRQAREAVYRALKEEGNGQMCPVLRKTVPYGLAYHHSGLTMDERKLIEEAYSEGTLCLLTCTSTLAAGVNLPAKRVILRAPYVGMNFLQRSQYKQMVGRAGRAGIDTSGESIVIVKKKDKEKLLDLISGPYDSCMSSLMYDSAKGVRSLLLTTIGLKLTPTIESVIELMRRTLLDIQSSTLGLDIPDITKDALQSLIDLGMVKQTRTRIDGSDDPLSQITSQSPIITHIEVTRLGKATFKGSVDIQRAPTLFTDLCKAQKSLVVSNHLHLLYLATPYDYIEQVNIDWMLYFNQFSLLSPEEMKVAEIMGISESYICRKASGQVRKSQEVNELPMRRFFLTLVLYDLWKEKTMWEVSLKFKLDRGLIQNILNGAVSFASCVFHFCEELEEFWAYQELLETFVRKLSYCVTMELIPLMEIPGVKQGRARQLFNAGFKTLALVANAETETLVKNVENLSNKAANQIITSAKMLLNEQVENLRAEADSLVTMPTDVNNAQIGTNNKAILNETSDNLHLPYASTQLNQSQLSYGSSQASEASLPYASSQNLLFPVE